MTDCNQKYQNAPGYLYCTYSGRCAEKNSAITSPPCEKPSASACPQGYKFMGIYKAAADKYCSSTATSAKVAGCAQDPKSTYWNPLIQSLYTDDGFNLDTTDPNFDQNLEAAFKCCSGRVSKDAGKTSRAAEECGDLYVEKDKECETSECYVLQGEYCLDPDHPERLLDGDCQTYCNKNLSDCNKPLRDLCADKVGDLTYRNICACYYPSEVYSNMAEEIAAEYNLAGDILDAQPQCIYHDCQTAAIQAPPSNKPCPDINIASCTQSVTVNSNGEVDLDEMKVDQKCENYMYPKNDDVNSGGKTSVNSGDTTSNTCSVNANCGTSQTCTNGKCTAKEKSFIAKYWWVILIAVVLVITVAGGFYFYKKKSSSTNEA